MFLDADELTDIAEYYEWVAHDTEKSRQVIDYALSIHPDAIDPAIFKARGFMVDDNLDEAALCADAIADQTDREVCFLQAEILLRKNRPADALGLLYQRMSDQSEPDLYLYDAAFILVDYRAFQEAHALAGVLQQMAPHWFKTYEVMAAINIGLENFEEVIPYADHMLAIDPFFDIAWDNKAEALIGLQRYQEAQECINYLLAIKPDDLHALELKAEVLMNAFNPEAAHLLYTRLIAINSFSPEFYLNDAYCLLQIGLFAEALTQIQMAESLTESPDSRPLTLDSLPQSAAVLGGSDPFFTHIQVVKAALLSKLHRPDEALSLLDALVPSPQSPVPRYSSPSSRDSEIPKSGNSAVLGGSLLCVRAKIYAEAGRVEEARAAFEAYRHSPDITDAQACYNYGVMLIDAECYQMALDIFNEIPETAILQLDAPNPQGSLLLYKMICYHNLNQLKPMLECLQGCINNPVDFFDIYFSRYISENLTPQAYYDHYSTLLNDTLPF